MTEREWKFAVVAALIVVVVLWRVGSAHVERRRREWFDRLTAALHAKAEHTSENQSRCTATVERRSFEITHGYRAGAPGDSTNPGWALRSHTPLQGVSDIYNIRFRRAWNGDVETHLHGFAPRDGWQTPSLKEALERLMQATSRLDSVDVEAGALMFRTKRKLDGEELRTIVVQQSVLADEIERAL